MIAALLKSIEENNPDYEKYVIYILSDKLSTFNKNRLLESTELKIRFVDVTGDLIDQVKLPDKLDYLPKTAYFRLMIPELFSAFEKVIYLDADILVLTDLEKLWEIDMEGNLSLAVECFYASDHRGKDNFRKLGIDENAPYFNSGVMVIDVQKWRDFNVREKVNSVLNGKLNAPDAMDEEGLNVVLHGRWKPLDRGWNYPPHIVDRDNLPYIVHFIGYKPMYFDYKTGLQDLFFYYLEGTPWEEQKIYGFFKKAYIKAPFIFNIYLKKFATLRAFFNL